MKRMAATGRMVPLLLVIDHRKNSGNIALFICLSCGECCVGERVVVVVGG